MGAVRENVIWELSEIIELNKGLTNRYVGYSSDARLLIINADDFGMCHSINEATLRALRDGVVSSTSLMVPCPWAPHAIRILQEHPDIPFGVHLTLISDFNDYRWGPVSSKNRVSSLLDETGSFYRGGRIPELLAQAALTEIEREFRAQIDVVMAADLKPAHLDWHCLADGGRVDIFEMTLRLAKAYGLALRVHSRPAAERCHGLGLPTVDHEILDSYRIGMTDKSARYAQLIRALPPGLSEWAVHPSLDTAEYRAMDPANWRVRPADFSFLISQAARDLLEDEDIILLNYRVLQDVWAR